LFLLSLSILLKAQPEKDSVIIVKMHPKILFGMVFALSGGTSFSQAPKPFSLGYNLLPNICIVTNKAFGRLMYGLGNNAIKIAGGYVFGGGWDVYAAGYKCLDTRSKYVGSGIERKIKAGDVNFFIFLEYGYNFDPTSKLLSLGFHANMDVPFKKKK
jgi:hypothetical protein